MRSQLIMWCILVRFNKYALNMVDLLALALIEPFITSSRKIILFPLWPMVRAKLWPINHPSLSSPCLTALFSTLPSPFTLNFTSVQSHSTKSRLLIRRPGPPRALIGGEFVTWRRRDQWETRSGVNKVEGDQLSRIRLFGYLPQKLNLKYEMYICSSCIWGRGTLVTELDVW